MLRLAQAHIAGAPPGFDLYKTAAELLAMGSDHGISASLPTRAWVIDQGKAVECSAVTGPNSSTWVQRVEDHWYQPFNTPADEAKRYYVWDGLSLAASIAYNARRILPWAGEVRRFHWSSSSDPGSTIIGVHFDLNTTAAETETIEPAGSSGNYSATAEFSASTFTAQTVLTISADPTNSPGFSRVALDVEFLIPLEA